MADQPELSNIQGLTIRAFGMPFAKHIVLTIEKASAAAEYLGKLVEGDGSDLPQITPATTWTSKPHNALALGITHEGLTALGLPKSTLTSFPLAFQQGAIKRAKIVGDVGTNDPDNWQYGFNSTNVHLILSLYAVSKDELESASDSLTDAFTSGGAGSVLSQIDANIFPDGKIHFGYTDGISNPNIAGMTPDPLADDQPEAPPGEFFLGYPNQFATSTAPDAKYIVPQPSELGMDGSYYAFRILEQDVEAFEQFLQDQASATGQSDEWVAAKLVGRWRNGNPLELTPDTADPDPAIPSDEIDEYNYIKTDTNPDDSKGIRCPIGAHMRRSNPRSENVQGGPGAGNERRIMRRGIPYGPVYNPNKPDPKPVQRGLVGPFIVGDINAQFEFVMQNWVNGSEFTANLPPGSGDPILTNVPSNEFWIPVQDGQSTSKIKIKDVPQLVYTRGGAYCFMPSLNAIRFLAGQTSSA